MSDQHASGSPKDGDLLYTEPVVLPSSIPAAYAADVTSRETRASFMARRAPAFPRLGHCTPTLGGHSPACDRDGTYCSASSSHAGPCTPHGRRADVYPPAIREDEIIDFEDNLPGW